MPSETKALRIDRTMESGVALHFDKIGSCVPFSHTDHATRIFTARVAVLVAVIIKL